MIKYLLSPLFFRKLASYEYGGSVSSAVDRLKSSVVGMELHNPFQQCLVGKVSEANVILRRYRPFWRNSEIPIFRGKFVLRNGIAVLEGEYSMHKFEKIITTIWLSGVTAFSLMFIIDAFTASHKENILFSLGITASILVFGVIFLRIGWVLGRRDIDYIEAIIHKSIK